jgi:hypothetical protein
VTPEEWPPSPTSEWAGLIFTDPHFGEVFGPEQRVLSPQQLRPLREAIQARLDS